MSRRVVIVLLLLALPTITLGQGGTQGFWTAISPTPTAHGSHTITTLSDSKILVAGGLLGPTGPAGMMTLPPSTSAELYRPEFNDWLPVGSMAGARYLHGAAPIFGGTAVLVAGGFNTPISLIPPLTANLGDDTFFGFGSCGTAPAFGAITTAEIFNENTLGWTPAASMNVARAQFTMVTLFNGQVLAAGGGSAELYTPATDTWARTSGMQATRFGAAGALLPDGRVFLAGGDSGAPSFLGNFCPADAEVYDPSVNIWFNAGGMTVNHYHGTATLYHLPDGSPRVLVAGGYDGNAATSVAISTVESWNPATGTFIPVPDMLVPRVFHDATLRADGKILVTGGNNEIGDVESRSEVYDPVTNSWSIAAPMIFPHAGHTAVNVTDPLNGQPTGKILVAGGLAGQIAAEIFQPTPLASITSIEAHTLPFSNAVSACQPGAITASIGSATGLGSPTGSVNFFDFGSLIEVGAPVDNTGTATDFNLLPAGNHQVSASYFGDSNFLPSNSQTLAVQSVSPAIVVSGPATATAGAHVTLTASVPNGAVAPFSFVWTLPGGANVAGNGNSILVTPTIGQNQYTANGSDSDACGLAPGMFSVFGYAPGVLLNSRVVALSRDATTGDIIAALTVTNNGTDTASVQVTGSTLNNISTSTMLPVPLGNLASGQINAVFLHYPGTAGVPGSTVVLRLNLAFTDLQTATGGTAGGGFRVTIP